MGLAEDIEIVDSPEFVEFLRNKLMVINEKV